jgi:hypothetical protein
MTGRSQPLVAPASPRASEKLQRAFYVLCIFTLIGPIVAGIAIYCVTIATQFANAQKPVLTDVFNIVFVSFVGGRPFALLVGVLVVAWEWTRRPTILAAMAASVVGSIIFYFLIRSLQPPLYFLFCDGRPAATSLNDLVTCRADNFGHLLPADGVAFGKMR